MSDSEFTQSTEIRWKYLASAITAVLVLVLAVLLIGAALGVLTLSVISQAWFILYATSLSVSLVWLFGADAYNAVKGE